MANSRGSFTGKTISETCAGKGISRIAAAAAVLAVAFILTGCSGDSARYGVVLLSPNEDAVRTGSVVDIRERSEINETFTVIAPHDNQRYEMATWRIRSFNDSAKAESFANDYAPNVNLYADNRQDGLAVREKSSIDAPRVYKLREGQKVKVISKEKADTIGNHDGYWYQVLTTDGVSGYCFDYYLDIYDATAVQQDTENPAVADLREKLSRPYRPADFRTMVETERIRLDHFDPAYGLFVDLEAQTLRVNMYTFSHNFSFSGIRQASENSFNLVGSGVRLNLRADNSLQLVYTKDNQNYSPSFIYMEPEQIRSLIEEERTRRQEAFSQLEEDGPVYTSSAYGTLEFSAESNFRWNNFDRLVPRIIPSGNNGASGSGTVSFDHFLTDELKQDFDGVITLDFRQLSAEPLLFMYSLEAGRLKLEYVPREKTEERIVRERASYPLVMVFFAQDSQ